MLPGGGNLGRIPHKALVDKSKWRKLCVNDLFKLIERGQTFLAVSFRSASISQRYGSADPDLDPRQNVMDPEH